MENLTNDSASEQLHESGSADALDLLINPSFVSKPLKGTWEDGYRLRFSKSVPTECARRNLSYKSSPDGYRPLVRNRTIEFLRPGH
jgi:hypothetical protein